MCVPTAQCGEYLIMKNYKSNKPCVACGESRDGYVTLHHIYTRKAWPEYSEKDWNLIPVCQHHHNIFHSKPLSYMAKNYSAIKSWLEQNDWYDSEFNGWVHD